MSFDGQPRARKIRLPQFTQMSLDRFCRGPMVSASSAAQGIEFNNRGMLVLPGPVLASLFNAQLEPILEHVSDLLAVLPETDVLFLVGGMTESPVVVNAFQTRFADSCRVVHPPQPTLAVLQGSVIYGLRPRSICARISKLTLGVITNTRFNGAIHDEKRKIQNGKGKDRCEVFDPLVYRGDVVETGTPVICSYFPMTQKQNVGSFEVCSTSLDRAAFAKAKFVMYPDDSRLVRLGYFTIDTPASCGSTVERKISLSFDVGGTFLKATAECQRAKSQASININCFPDN